MQAQPVAAALHTFKDGASRDKSRNQTCQNRPDTGTFAAFCTPRKVRSSPPSLCSQSVRLVLSAVLTDEIKALVSQMNKPDDE